MRETLARDRDRARCAAWLVASALATAATFEARADDVTETFIDPRGGVIIADSRHTPGQTEGTFAALGYGIDGGVRATRGPHVFSGSFHVLSGLSFTLVSPDVVKGVDDARAATSYELHIAPWLSFSSWARVEAPLFGSRTLRATPSEFRIARADGLFAKKSGTSLDLTGPFAPLIVDEALGLALHPLRRDLLWIDVAAGIGAEHTFASGQLYVDDNPHTRQIEVLELESYHALTPLASLAAGGDIEKRVAYAADVELRLPVLHTDTRAGADASILELSEIAARHTLKIVLTPWLTVDYELSVGTRPLLARGVRIDNRLMLSAHPFNPPRPR